MPVFEITKAAHFDAAHRLPGADGRYTQLHGHSFRVEATLRGEAIAPIVWVADLAELDAALRDLAGELDHSLLNDHAGLESPTLESLCLHFASGLGERFPALVRVAVARPSVGESCVLELASPPARGDAGRRRRGRKRS